MDYAYETCAGDGDDTKYCPKDYSWGSWLPWSKCFPECGSDSKKIRQRNCLPPVGKCTYIKVKSSEPSKPSDESFEFLFCQYPICQTICRLRIKIK